MRERKAISTIILVLIVLCAVIFGAFISYMWVMANYYNMPQNTTLLVVEDVNFTTTDFTYFNVTVLNPSNSAYDVNITGFNLIVEGKNEIYNVTAARYPSYLPFLLERGKRETFKCESNWSFLAGETIRVEPITENASIRSFPYTTPQAKLKMTPSFDAARTVENFHLTVDAAYSTVALNISDIMIFGESLNVTPSLPHTLLPNDVATFECERNWEDLRGQNVTFTLKTMEGYELDYNASEVPSVTIYISEIKLNNKDSSSFDLIVKSSEDSTASGTLSQLNLTLSDGSTITPSTVPQLNVSILPIVMTPNRTLTIKCLWNWVAHRNEMVTASVYTEQGFTIDNKTFATPPATIWEITDVKFDLSDKNHFLVNVTNTQLSLQDIRVTVIAFDENETTFAPQTIKVGEWQQFDCTFNWQSFVGEDANITAYASDNLNSSKNVTLPSVNLQLLEVAFDNSTETPQVRITVSNSNFSTQNATATRIIFKIENSNSTTQIELGPNGLVIGIGANATIICPYYWYSSGNQQLTINVETLEGFTASQTIQIPDRTP